MRSCGLQFHKADEFGQLTTCWLLNLKTLRCIHSGFPATLTDEKSIAISSIHERPFQQGSQVRVQPAKPNGIPCSIEYGFCTEVRKAPGDGCTALRSIHGDHIHGSVLS